MGAVSSCSYPTLTTSWICILCSRVESLRVLQMANVSQMANRFHATILMIPSPFVNLRLFFFS